MRRPRFRHGAATAKEPREPVGRSPAGQRAGLGIRASLLGLLVALPVALASCGQAQYTYVKNAEDKLYFKVPSSWGQVNQKELELALSDFAPESASAQAEQTLTWSVAFDANREPSAGHVVLGSLLDQPVAYARVQRLTPQQQGDVSLNAMRDIMLPVTDEAREAVDQIGLMVPGFELLRDEVLTPGEGLHGVRSVFNYQFKGDVQTFDQTVLANEDASKVYLLLVRCSASCYREKSGELDDVARSLRVRS